MAASSSIFNSEQSLEMKRLILFIGISLLVVIALDFAAGRATKSYLRTHRLPGDCASIDYAIKDLDEEVVILGNSVALNSLMPSILMDSLSMSVYNAASNGQEIDFFHSILDCILRHHKPHTVIMGLRYDVFTTTGVGARYGILAPYYDMGYEIVDSCLREGAGKADVMLNSTFFRFNKIWLRILLYHFVVPNEQGENGFIAKPLPPVAPTLLEAGSSHAINPQRVATLEKIVALCREAGIRLVLVFPPLYYDTSASTSADSVGTICNRLDLTVIDDTSDPYFLKHPELFYDNAHLNKDGAEIYSRTKASQLKKIIK